MSFEVPELERFDVAYDDLPSRSALLAQSLNPFARRSAFPRAPGVVSVLLRSLMANRQDFTRNMTDEDLRAGAVEFVHDVPEALERASQGACVFLIQPVGIREVVDLSDKGERMPQKSTFFHPKMGTGMVFNPLYP